MLVLGTHSMHTVSTPSAGSRLGCGSAVFTVARTLHTDFHVCQRVCVHTRDTRNDLQSGATTKHRTYLRAGVYNRESATIYGQAAQRHKSLIRNCPSIIILSSLRPLSFGVLLFQIPSPSLAFPFHLTSVASRCNFKR